MFIIHQLCISLARTVLDCVPEVSLIVSVDCLWDNYLIFSEETIVRRIMSSDDYMGKLEALNLKINKNIAHLIEV